MNRTPWLFLLALCISTPALAQDLGASINDDGFIVLHGEDVPLLGLEFESAGGFLVPTDGGPSPFDLFVRNNNDQIIYGTLGREVVVEGELILSAGYSNGQNFEGDLTGKWGGPEFEGPIAFGTASDFIDDGSDGMDVPDDGMGTSGGGADPIVDDVTVPEPATLGMLFIAMMSLLSFRGRRRI